MELTGIDRILGPQERAATSETFTVLGHPDRAQVLLPRGSSRAAGQSLIRYHGGMGVGGRIARRGASLLARLGILDLVVRQRRFVDFGNSEDPNSLRSILSNATREESLAVAISLGPPRANQKPVLRVMNHHGETLAFAKIGWNELTNRLVDAEVDALSEASLRALTTVLVPEVLFHGNWGSNRIAVFKALEAGPGRVEPGPDQFLDVARCWPTSTHKLQMTSFFSRLVADLTRVEGPNGTLAREVLDGLETTYGESSLLFGGWHGDWTPWNNARTSDGRIALWDWERAGGQAPLGFDALHYRFQPESLRGARPLGQLLDSAIRPEDASLAGNDPRTVGHLYVAALAARHLQPGAETGPVDQYGRFLGELAAILRGRSADEGPVRETRA